MDARTLDPAIDPLYPAADVLPSGRRHDLVTTTDAVPSDPEVRPFGLRFATADVPVVSVDVAGVRYDPQRQVNVDPAGSPMCRHTTGKTSTRTSDGHQGMDSDDDVRED